jgi:hypothetical protein
MPIIKKTVLPLNLLEYDVFIEDTSQISEYFTVTSIPNSFTGGRNSFLIGGSEYLEEGSEIKLEIIDAKGNPIYQSLVPTYVEGDSRMVSVEIYDDTAPGFATIVIMGKTVVTTKGQPVPNEWQDAYNVRWTRKILVDYDLKNTSPIRFETQPEVLVKENRFFSINSSSYDTYNIPFTASLSPLIFSPVQIGYAVDAVPASVFTPEHKTGKFTGSLTINGTSESIDLPITNILNKDKAFIKGYLISSPLTDGIIKQIYLKSGSYTTNLESNSYDVTSSMKLQYYVVNTSSVNIPISYANLRVSNLATVSGELYKFRIYTKVATNITDYKLVADVPITNEEILVTSSIRGNIPIGDIFTTPNYQTNWYAGKLQTNTGTRKQLYLVSGSINYYDPSNTTNLFVLSSSNDTLLSSVYANVPIDLTTNKFQGQVSESGYFIGTSGSYLVFPTSEYTLTLDAYYKNTSSSINLVGNTPNVDIYIIGLESTRVIDNNPLGQKVGQLKVVGNSQWFQNSRFNFFPAIKASGKIGLRFVISNGFWNFSNISIKPASDPQFSPDEVSLLIPNMEYHNELLQYKVEFFDINNNSVNVSVISTPAFFTGSAMDLGTLP